MLICCAFLFAVLVNGQGVWDKSTKVTFSNRVELPGMVLQAGTYTFKLADSVADRHIVQVFSEDGMHLYGMILAIPNERLEAKGETVLNFEERPKNEPLAIKAWFYPGDTFGQEFVYPKMRATQLAEVNRMPVLAGEVKPTEEIKELEETPVVTITPERAPEIAAALPEAIAAEPAPEPIAAELAPELPKTASPLPLLFLLGISSLGIAGALKVTS